MNTLPIIRIKKVNRNYLSNGKIIEGIKNINFEIYPNEIISIVGASGCGKTTILKLISNILKPDTGEILYENKNISYAISERLIGYVPQNFSLLPNRNVIKNIMLPLEIIGQKDTKYIGQIIKNLSLSDYLDLYPHQLSGGMQQRVAIARALAYKPRIILMDEPFSSLDEMMRDKLNSELLTIRKKIGQSIVFVTHNIEEAVFLSDRVIVMSNHPGKIIDVIKIYLPKTRTLNIKNSKIFFKEVCKVRKLLKYHHD